MQKPTLIALVAILSAATLLTAVEATAQERGGRAFARVDANQDGKLTPEEFRAFADQVRQSR